MEGRSRHHLHDRRRPTCCINSINCQTYSPQDLRKIKGGKGFDPWHTGAAKLTIYIYIYCQFGCTCVPWIETLTAFDLPQILGRICLTINTINTTRRTPPVVKMVARPSLHGTSMCSRVQQEREESWHGPTQKFSEMLCVSRKLGWTCFIKSRIGDVQMWNFQLASWDKCARNRQWTKFIPCPIQKRNKRQFFSPSWQGELNVDLVFLKDNSRE